MYGLTSPYNDPLNFCYDFTFIVAKLNDCANIFTRLDLYRNICIVSERGIYKMIKLCKIDYKL